MIYSDNDCKENVIKEGINYDELLRSKSQIIIRLVPSPIKTICA